MSIEETATVCSPIKSLKDLLNVSASSLTARLRSSPLIQRYVSPRAKVLLCHDMRGGYLEDKHTQGCCVNEISYRFFRWHLIDIFIYFAHELVTIPPLVWIDGAHQNGVQILGTFITEFDAGKAICRELLASDENVDRAVEALVLLMDWHHFDGYLLNIENPIEPEHVPRLLSFVSKLKSACTKHDAASVVLWYDSVTIGGELKWQNQLNELNQAYFHACDGIFLNYTWKAEFLLQSKINAGERDRDVFVGVDVFGRGCFGGGGFNTCEAMAVGHQLGLSTALFAPGWLFETLKPDEFLENDRKFWNSLEPYTSERVLQLKSFSTFFSDGFGEQFFLHGLNVAQHRWYHLGLQSYLPNSVSENQWLLNHDDAYFGGSCLEIPRDTKGSLHLFKCLIPIESCVEITLVLKANVDVMVELTCADGSLLLSENYDENLRIRGWQRKVCRLVVEERKAITSVSIFYDDKSDSSIKLGYLSIRPVHSILPDVRSSRPILQSTDEQSSTSITLHFDDSIQQQLSTMIFIFVRDQFERYKFLGATRQLYFKIFYSDMNSERGEHSTLVVRHYSLETLDLLNEQILPISRKWDCLQGFCSTIKQ